MGMKLACATLCFRKRITDEILDTLTYASKAGFRSIEIAGPITWDAGSIQLVDRSKFKDALRQAQMELTGSFFCPLPTVTPEAAIEGARYANMVADFVKEMGGKLLLSCGGPRQPGDRGLVNTVRGLAKIIEHIEGSDLRIALESLDPEAENCGLASGKQVCLPSDYEFLFKNLPSDKIGVCLDIGHVYSTGIDVVDFIHRFAGKIFNVHFKDQIGSKSVPLGQGEMDLPAIVKALRDIGYDGYVALEIEQQDPAEAPRNVEEGWTRLKKLLA